MKTALLILLALATALATAAAVGACAACSNPRFGLLGAGFYATMLVAAAIRGPTRPIAVALFGALGFHAGLLATGLACPLCWACAACSAAIALLLVRDHAPALVAAPWAAAVALALARPPAPPPPRTVVVYEQPGCPHCDDLKTRVMPEATRDLDVDVRYRPAPLWVRATPTVVIGTRVLEGVPPPDLLRRAIVEGLAP